MATRSTVYPAPQTDGDLASPWTFPFYPSQKRVQEVGGWMTTDGTGDPHSAQVAHGITTTGDWQLSFLADSVTGATCGFLVVSTGLNGYFIRFGTVLVVEIVTGGAAGADIINAARNSSSGTPTFIEVTYTASTNTFEAFEDGVSRGTGTESTYEATNKSVIIPVLVSSTAPLIQNAFIQDYIEVRGTYPFPIQPPVIGPNSTLYGPTVTRGTVFVLPPLIGPGSQVFAPTVVQGAQAIAPPQIAAASTLAAPTVTPGAVTLAPPAIGPGSSLAAPTVVPGQINLSPPAIASTATTSAPTVVPGATQLSAPVISSTASQFGPTLVPGPVALVMSTIAAGSATFEPVVFQGGTLAMPTIGPDSVLHAPTLTPGQVLLAMPTIASGAVMYAPVVVPVGPQLAAPAIAAGSTLYAPAVTVGGITLSLPAIGPGSSLYAPTLTAGAVQLALAFIASTATLHAPTVTLGVPFVDSGTIELSVSAAQVFLSAILATLTIDAEQAEIMIGTP